MELDDHRYGVYRDEQDALYIVDILCPHMGCTLQFNADEKPGTAPVTDPDFPIPGKLSKGLPRRSYIPYMRSITRLILIF